ncbi:MAG: hypothetical protein NTV65_10825 [Proteobacteria bacterium]|nr:hypothetical protein [Pseudomonadota bacterium]
MKKLVKIVSEKIKTACQYTAASFAAPSEAQVRTIIFLAGISMLAISLSLDATAQGTGGGGNTYTKYNDAKVANAVNAIMTYLEGSFGALIMAASGIGAIMSAAFGQYKAALSLMVVAVGAFILRSIMSTFFNDQNIQN